MAHYHILPNDDRRDVQALCETHKDIKIFVSSQLKDCDRATLVIDDNTLNEYPVPKYSSLFRYYGSLAKSVEMKNIFGHELELLIPLFTNAESLTLRNVNVKNRIAKSDNRIRRLSLINTEFINTGCDMLILESWLPILPQLESLYLEEKQYWGFPQKRLPPLPQLKSLSVIRATIKGCYSYEDFPLLTHLTIDFIEGQSPNWFQNLRLAELRIRQVVDPKYKPDLEKMNIPKLDVFFLPVPTESEDTPILLLNEDCLWHLQGFLPHGEWTALRKTHPHFQKLKIRHVYWINQYNEELENELPDIGPLVSKLEIREIFPEDVIRILNHFPSLRELDLGLKQSHVDLANSIPRGLRSLSLRIGYNADVNIFNNLKEIKGVQELIISEYLIITPDVLHFLRNNQETLVRISMDGIKDVDHSHECEFWKILARMPSLEKLDLYTQEYMTDPESVLKNTNLKRLTTQCTETLSKIKNLPNLTHLNCGYINDKVALRLVKLLPRLLEVASSEMVISRAGLEKIRRESKRLNRKCPFNDFWVDSSRF